MKRGRKDSGFSLVEALVVVAIILIMSAAAIVQIQSTLKRAKSDTALTLASNQLRRYHEAAVNQRQIYRVTLKSPREIDVDQVTINSGNGDLQFNPISTIYLPNETQFLCVTGIPTTKNALPDTFGDGKTAVDFSLDYGGGGNEIFFQRDGRATDENGRPNNGVLYIAQPGDVSSSKAITVWGATGHIKEWRISGDFSTWVAK